MQIFLEDDAVQALEVSCAMTVGQLRAQVNSAEARLMVNGQLLDNEEASLEDYGIQSESTVQIVHPVLGGGRKRKKKVYTTPKKIKHKRTKVKLATLKYYKVDDVGKLERKRKECPHEICGAGIFMSNHKDRQYCGKCGLTIKFDENK
jgi:small subunit ribosomal protein S27Ae